MLPIGLGLDEHHLFRETVGRVCFFGVAVPYFVFTERNGCKFRIGTDSAESNKFINLLRVPLVEKLYPHHGVFIEKRRGIFPVKSDTADLRGEVNYNIGFGFAVHLSYVGNTHKVVFRQIGNGDMFAAMLLE